MNILLIIPPPASIDHPLLGVASLAAVAENHGHHVAILDLNILCYRSGLLSQSYWQKESYDQWTSASFLSTIWEQVKNYFETTLKTSFFEYTWDVVGLHVNYGSKQMALWLTELIRGLLPKTMIVAGGPEFFPNQKPVETQLPFDAIFLGEAETSFISWLSGSQNKGVIESQPQLLANLPMPSYQAFPLSSYTRSGVFPMEISRGCVNRCAFCCDRLIRQKYKTKTPNQIKNELMQMTAQGVHHISFCDSTLNANPKLFSSLLQILSEMSLSWNGMIQSRRIDDSLAEQMQKSGCQSVFIGVESFSPSFLSHLNKQYVSKEAEKSIISLATKGIDVSIGIIVAGPPLQSEVELTHDLAVLRKLAPFLDTVAINPLNIPNGTPLWQKGETLGILGLDKSYGWKFWHSGKGVQDIAQRLRWCHRIIEELKEMGISMGSNYTNFENFMEQQLDEARREMCDTFESVGTV